MLTAIFLHGHLGDKYGKKLMLDVDSVAGAVALLKANFVGFARDVIGHGNRYRVFVGKTNIGKDELANALSGQDVHIVPVVAGAGGNGSVIQIIVGIVLVVVGVLFSEFGGAFLIELGVGMIIGGVLGLVFAPGKVSLSGATIGEKKISRFFNGAANTTAQGNPVPVLYGQLLVGSQVVSGGLSDEDY